VPMLATDRRLCLSGFGRMARRFAVCEPLLVPEWRDGTRHPGLAEVGRAVMVRDRSYWAGVRR
jgi:hypothetical protein